MDTTLYSVTQIEIIYTADQACNLGLSGMAVNGADTNNYGYIAPLAKGTNVTKVLKLGDFDYSWSDVGAAKDVPLTFSQVQGLAVEAGEFVGASNVTVTSLKLYGYVKPTTGTTDPKDTVQLIGNADYDFYGYDDKGTADDVATVKNSATSLEIDLSRPADNFYPGAGMSGPTDKFTMDKVVSIELTYSSDVDFEISLPMTTLGENDAAHSQILEKGSKTVLLNVGQFEQAYGTQTALDLSKVEGFGLSLTDELKGKITITSAKLIYTGEVVALPSVKSVTGKALSVTGIVGNKLNLTVPVAGQYEIAIYSVNGQKLGSMSATLAAGAASLNLNDLNLGSRMAIVQVTGASVQSVQKVMIK